MSKITIEKEEYNSLIETNNYYKEIIDTYEALKVALEEKETWSIKKLWSLADLL